MTTNGRWTDRVSLWRGDITRLDAGAIVNYNHARADTDALFPGRANSGSAVGYRYLDTTLLTNGMHSIAWSVTDNLGRRGDRQPVFLHLEQQRGGVQGARLRSNRKCGREQA